MIGLVFPGQGSQSLGMGKFLVDNFPIAKKRVSESSEALGIDMAHLLFESSDADLARTENTQPALLTVSVATWDVIKSVYPISFNCSAGHSIGEYAAMVVNGVMDFSDAVKAVRARGIAMQEAVPAGKGGMLAVLGLSDDQVRELCQWVNREFPDGLISPANFNSPGQVVISGHLSSIEWLKTHFKPEVLTGEAKRVKFIPLSVSAPFHCSLMAPAEKKMSEVLSRIEFKNSDKPIIQNVHALPETQASILRENLIKQVCAPVLWTQCALKMKEFGATVLIETGHGKVLSGLMKKIDPELSVININSLEDVKTLGAHIGST